MAYNSFHGPKLGFTVVKKRLVKMTKFVNGNL